MSKVIENINRKLDLYKSIAVKLPLQSVESYKDSFFVNYTHHSTAIEGNTLTLIETKVILEDQLSVGGKNLREIFEVYNHKKAYSYMQEKINAGEILNEKIVKDIHAILMENIMVGGIYRDGSVRIQGASFQPPTGNDMYHAVKNFYADFSWKQKENPIAYAAWTHAEFVRIHPFFDGNGRTARILLNYQLMSKGLLPVNVKKEDRLEYYNVLDRFAATGFIEPFVDFVAELENFELDQYLAIAVDQQLISAADIVK